MQQALVRVGNLPAELGLLLGCEDVLGVVGEYSVAQTACPEGLEHA